LFVSKGTPLSDIGDVSRFLLICLGPLVVLLPKSFKLFGFQIF
jgi:hypothetical protein